MIKEFIKNKKYGYLVDNTWVYTENYKEVFSPIDDSLVGKLPLMNTKQIDECIESSYNAFLKWRDTSKNYRVNILYKVSDIIKEEKEDLTLLITEEVGKSYKEASDEVVRTADIITFYATEAQRILGEVLYSESFPGFGKEKMAITQKVPLGIVVSIPPFNYPLNETIPKIIGAIVTGNTTILKAPNQGGITCMVIGEIFRKAGLDNGVLNIVSGDNDIAGDYLLQSKKINALNFTGSTKTAVHIQKVLSQRNTVLPTILLGLGGKDASIVLPDADLNLAAEQIAIGAFSFSGQRCTAIKRVLIDNTIADEFIDKLKEVIKKKFILGDPRNKENTIGPVINDITVNYLHTLKEDALKKGAQLVVSGEDNGRYIYPIVLDHITEDMRLAWEEPFSPILPIIRVNNINEAITIANKSEYGLQSSIFTKNIDDAFYIASQLDVGNVQINGKDSRGPDNFPFNGTKSSGIGNIQGAKYLIDSLTRIKTTVLNFKNHE